ncbi:MAG: epimerase [Bdellovibrionaceae bacterium]|nr:epimerase [Pseudobdellovibrionaceae bacterium]|tara:strand:+ start:1297 stop:2310 length:1014 start_codon:yes stop_codon:yes gene_type:complete
MKSQKVFISGVAGFLGSHVADLLVRQGHHVVGADDLSGGNFDNVPSRVEFLEYDLRDRRKNLKALEGVDVVFHAAAMAHDGFSVFAPHLITENLFATTSSLVSASLQQRVKRFVFCSSMSRYGNQNSALFTEDMEAKPQTPYGIAKLSCENLIRNLCETHGMEWVVAVPHNIIGPRQKYDDPYRNVVAIMINRMLQNKSPIVYGDGEQKRCFSPIQDVLPLIPHLLFDPKAQGEVINVGPDKEFVTINELVQMINHTLGTDYVPHYLNPRPNEVAEANCSSQKAQKLFGYKPTSQTQQTISEMVEWIKAQGPKPFQYNHEVEIESPQTPLTWKERIF